jgi:hypothetical protein
VIDVVLAHTDDDWGWCRSCQCLYSFGALMNPWSCPAGGRHNRNSGDEPPEQRSGRYRLPAVPADRPAVASPERDDGGAGVPAAVARWPLAEHFDDVVSLSRRSVSSSTGVALTGSPDDAADFAGGAIEVADPDFGVAAGSMTLNWWMRAQTEQPQNATLLDHRAGISGTSARERASAGFSVFVNSGRLGVQLADGVTAQNYVDDAALVVRAVPTWVMATITIGTGLQFYVDGKQVATFGPEQLGARSGTSRDAGSAALVIGRHRIDGGPAYRGLLADLRVFDRTLAPDDVAALFAATSSRRASVPEADGWLRCTACGLLVHRAPGLSTPAGCHARGGGAHAVDGSTSFEIGSGEAARSDDRAAEDPPAEDLPADDLPAGNLPVAAPHSGWSKCRDCRALFFQPFAPLSSCGTGGQHRSDGSSFVLDYSRLPDFTAVDQRAGADSVLFLGANKMGHTVLELQNEKRYLEEALDGKPIDVWGMLNARRESILGAIHDNGPRYVQLSAHGTDDDVEAGGLWLAGSDGPVTGEELASIFAEANDGRHGGGGGVEVVVLNACRSADRGRLIGRHVPYVIAVERDIPDQAAIFFTPMFYERLAAGATVEDALIATRAELEIDAHFDPEEIPVFVSTPTDSVLLT